jgi:hypothetical protein
MASRMSSPLSIRVQASVSEQQKKMRDIIEVAENFCNDAEDVEQRCQITLRRSKSLMKTVAESWSENAWLRTKLRKTEGASRDQIHPSETPVLTRFNGISFCW